MIVRDIVNSTRDDTDKVAAVMDVLMPLHAYICTSAPRRPLRVGKALYKLTEAISHYSDEDGIILATVADEGEASSSPILEELKELHTASGSRTVVRKQRRK